MKRETGARKRFLELLLDPNTPGRISFKEVSERTGLKRGDVGQAIRSPRFESVRRGWRIEVTGAGRGGERFLVQTKKIQTSRAA